MPLKHMFEARDPILLLNSWYLLRLYEMGKDQLWYEKSGNFEQKTRPKDFTNGGYNYIKDKYSIMDGNLHQCGMAHSCLHCVRILHLLHAASIPSL